MKLAVVNGSPRGKKSHSSQIIDWITEGMADVETVYAADIKKQDEAVDIIRSADSILFVFPLYTDMMPGLVKSFMEKMSRKDFSGKTITFIVHSGFPGGVHLRTMGRYCEYFAKLCSMNLLGYAALGGSEGGLPNKRRAAKDNRVALLKYIGSCIKEGKKIDMEKTKGLCRYESLDKNAEAVLKFMPLNMPWHLKMIKNGVFSKRWDKPYLSE